MGGVGMWVGGLFGEVGNIEILKVVFSLTILQRYTSMYDGGCFIILYDHRSLTRGVNYVMQI